MANKNKSRKFFATATSAALVASAIVPVASAASFTDADNIGSWAKEAVDFLADKEIITGNPDGSFNPEGKIERAQAAKMFTVALDLSTEGTEDFSDVTEGQWFYKYVVAVSNAGIVEGKGEGLFAPKANLTRAEAAKMIVEAYKLTGETDLSTFADADTVAGKWSEKYLSTAVANGIIKGKDGKLAANDSISRQEFAVMLKRAIDSESEVAEEVTVKSVTAVNGTLTVKLAEKAEAVSVEDFTVTQAINGGEAKEVTPSKAELSEDGLTVTLTVAEVAAQETTSQSVVYTVNEVAADAFVVEATTPVVESVTAINAKQIKVTFNTKVDKVTAETVGNYSITAANTDARGTITVTPSTGAELQEDGKSVILDIESTPLNSKSGAKYFVKVSNVKEFTGKEVTEFSEVVSLFDTTAVKVNEVSLSDSNTIKVEFSEPVNTTSSGVASAIKFKLDGINVSVPATAYTLSTDKTSVEVDIATAGLTTGKTYTIVVDGLTDFASNALVKYENTIEIAKDEVKPVVESVTVLSPQYVKVVFSEKIKNGTAGFKINVDGTDRTSSVTNADTTNPDGKSFIVNLGTAITEGNHVVSIYNYSDIAGNAGETITKEYKFAASKPALTSTTAEIKDIAGNKYAVFTYDRDVVRSETTVAATYVDKDGITKSTTLNVVGNAQVSGLAKNQIALDVTSAEEGTYSFKFVKGAVVDAYGQQADEVKLGFARNADTVKTTVTAVAPNTSSGTNTLNKVSVTFGAAVGTDALDVTKYTVDGVQVFESAIFDGNKQKVTLTLKDGALTTTGSKTIKVTGVSNVTDYSTTAEFRENVKPEVAKAELIGYDKIRLTFTEVVTASTIDDNDLEVLVNGVKTTQAITVAGSGTDTLIISLNAADKLTSSTIPVKVNIKSTNDLADATGNLVAAAEISNVVVNFVDTELSYNNAYTALTEAINKDLTVSSNLVAAKNALIAAQKAETAVSDKTHTSNITEAASLLTKVDEYIAAKSEAATKAAATSNATSAELNAAKTAIEAIETKASAVTSSLTITNLTAGITADKTKAVDANKATVKANMNAKFDITLAADQASTGKGKVTFVAPWIDDVNDTDSSAKFDVSATFTPNEGSAPTGVTLTWATNQYTISTQGTNDSTPRTAVIKVFAKDTLAQFFGITTADAIELTGTITDSMGAGAIELSKK